MSRKRRVSPEFTAMTRKCGEAGLGFLLIVFWTVSGVGALWFHWQAKYEDKVFKTIVESTTAGKVGQRERGRAILRATHDLVTPRFDIFSGAQYFSPVETIFRSPLLDLLDGKGACGSYTAVLVKLLQAAEIETRIAQMHCVRSRGAERTFVRGCHMFAEAKIDGHWAAMDALYDLVYISPDGRFAGVAEIQKDWDYYKTQTPSGFPVNWYTYQDVDYTNWDKIPYILPFFRDFLHDVFGVDVETLSLRSLLIDRFRMISWMFLVVWGSLSLLLLWRWFRNDQKRGVEIEGKVV